MNFSNNIYDNKKQNDSVLLAAPSPPSSTSSTSATCSSSSSLSSTSSSPSSSSPTPDSPSPLNGSSNNINNYNLYSSHNNSNLLNNNQITITHVIKPNATDRSFLETVHEEDVTNINESQEISNEKNTKKSIASISIQPSVSNEINENLETLKSYNEIISESSKAVTPNIESQELYQQLSQLKPLRSKYFKTSTSICLNRDANSIQPNIVGSHESNKLLQQDNTNINFIKTNSITLAPFQQTLLKNDIINADIISNNDKNKQTQVVNNIVKSSSASLNSTIVSYSSLSNSTFNAVNNLNKFNTNNNKLAISSPNEEDNLLLSNRMSNNVNGASESLNNSNLINTSTDTVISTSNLELNFNQESSQLSRRNSSLISNTSTCTAVPNSGSPILESSSLEDKALNHNLITASVQRRVSLSVTDL
jgi:hypothetical protein